MIFNPLIKAQHVYYDSKTSAYVLGRKTLINYNHIVRIEEDHYANEKKQITETVYQVDTIHDSHGHSLRVISRWIDKKMRD